MSILNKPDWSLGVWASDGNVEPVDSEKITLGWVAEKPLNEQMNWVQNRQDMMLSYINQRGVCEWDYKTQYPVGAFVSHNNVLYKASEENKDKDPTSNPNVWNIPFAYYNDFAELEVKVNATINEDGYLTHYVQKNAPVMNAQCRGLGYLDYEGRNGLNFSNGIPRMNRNDNVVAIFDEVTDFKDKSKKVVTMDVLQKVLEFYKVGDLYLTTNPANPSTTLGYGSWSRYGEGRALVGFNSSTSSASPDWTKSVGNTYGSYEHTLTIDQMPSHTHNMDVSVSIGGEGTIRNQNGYTGATKATMATGGSRPHNNVQPSIIVYVWRRVS